MATSQPTRATQLLSHLLFGTTAAWMRRTTTLRLAILMQVSPQ